MLRELAYNSHILQAQYANVTVDLTHYQLGWVLFSEDNVEHIPFRWLFQAIHDLFVCVCVCVWMQSDQLHE